jgi:hypothetical protein
LLKFQQNAGFFFRDASHSLATGILCQ